MDHPTAAMELDLARALCWLTLSAWAVLAGLVKSNALGDFRKGSGVFGQTLDDCTPIVQDQRIGRRFGLGDDERRSETRISCSIPLVIAFGITKAAPSMGLIGCVIF